MVTMKSYPIPRKGQLVLACGKCQKKLKRKLSKALMKRARQDEDRMRLRVVEVPCMKLCPKGGITVYTPGQVGRNECSIVRTRTDVDELYEECKVQHSMTLRARPAKEVSL